MPTHEAKLENIPSKTIELLRIYFSRYVPIHVVHNEDQATASTVTSLRIVLSAPVIEGAKNCTPSMKDPN